MVDLSKHLARARQALERRNYDLALEITEECQEVEPSNLENYRILLDAAKRRAKEGGKKGMFGTMSMPQMSKDPHKILTATVKKMTKTPDAKNFAAAGDAATKLHQSGVKGLGEVAIIFYEEQRATGLFSAEVLWNLATLYADRFKASGQADPEALEKALKTMAELERAVPNHQEAGRTIKNWEAMRSMVKRSTAGAATDYRSQLSSDDKARRQEAMNRMIRTAEDAKEVLGYIEQDLGVTPTDKSLWVKKGDIHRQMRQHAEAHAAYEKAQEIDPHDFVVTMRLGDTRVAEITGRIEAAKAAGQDITELSREMLQIEIEEYRRRVERQPTEMMHRYNLGQRLFKAGEIKGAASEFQQTVRDPKLRRPSHRYLGACFTKERLFPLAIQQYDSYLKLVDDDAADEAKEVRYSVARLHEEAGSKEVAATHYQRLVEIDLGFRDAATRLSKLRE
ncbi:MAG: tetratricopeptide repeat protein [Planctomycetes bacterium]|nr:tetratricopeptide repeat protein [Planctomycetota bacterium]